MASGRMTKKERLDVWRSRIRYAQDKRDEFFEGCGEEGQPNWVPGVDFAISVYRGQSKPKWWSDEDPWVHIGKLKSAIRAAVPSLLYSNPKFRVYPAQVDIENGVDVSYQRAKAKELWLNHIWQEANGNQHARVGINNAFFALGVIKSGWLQHFQDSEERGELAVDEATGEYILGADGDPVLEKGKFLLDERREKIRDEFGFPVLHPGKLTKEKWFLEVVDPRMMLFDTESGPDFFQHRFVIEEWVRPLADVKNDSRFSPAVRKRLVASESIHGKEQRGYFEKVNARGDGTSERAIQEDEDRIRGYDIYDFQNQRYMVLPESGVTGADENEDFLLDGPMPAGMEHGPFRFLKFTEDVGAEWYGVPDAIDMARVNQEYNITRSQMMIHREHTKTRYLVKDGTFTGEGTDAEEEMAKAAHGPDATFLRVTDTNGIQPMPKAQLDSSFAQAIPNISLDFNEVGGMPGESRGVADADTATQASILASGAELRNNDRRDNQVQTWLCEVARCLLISAQQNMTMDSVVVDKIIEETGVAPFRAVKLTPEELLGEFEVTVEVGSTMLKSDPRTQTQLLNLVTAVAQNPWIARVKGLMRRALDGINLDPVIAEELAMMADQAVAAEAGPPAPAGQQIGETVMGGLGNAAAGAPTGAPIN